MNFNFTLILVHGNDILALPVCREKLLYIEYFNTMFTGSFKESTMDIVKIDISNVTTIDIFRDIVLALMSGLQIKLEYFMQFLEVFKCYNFLGLSIAPLVDTARCLAISDKEFELFIDVIETIGYNYETIELINKFIPVTYDRARLPLDLLEQMLLLEKEERYFIITASSNPNTNSINVLDSKTGNMLCSLFFRKSK